MLRGFEAEIAAADIGRREVARVNAGALDDPLIGSFDAACRQILGKVVIGDAAGGQVAAGAGNARKRGHQA
ncbi:hypothetical protein D3C72_1759530 [compost metagenome]